MKVSNRSMRAELEQGIRDHTYMQLQQDWSINSNPPVERLSWPNYQQVERHAEGPVQMLEPMTPREPAPDGGMYSTKRGSGYTP
ncbi:MAG: hypothetical protein WBW27_27045 [Pseudolabrys sp.]